LDDIPHLPARIAVLAVAFCLSAFFSGSETALFSIQPDELERMKKRRGVDRIIARLREGPRRLLVTILFANTLVNVVFFSVSFTIVLRMSPQLGATGSLLLNMGSLLAIMLGGEVIPKSTAFAYYRPIARAAAYPMLAAQRLLTPVVVPLERIAGLAAWAVMRGEVTSMRPEELRLLVRTGAREGVLDPAAGEMIAEVIGLSDVRINEVMVPRVAMTCFNLEDPEEDLLALFRSSKLTTIPVYRGTKDQMLGLVHVKDVLLKPHGSPLPEQIKPAPFLPEGSTIEEALRECRARASKTAFVVDEYGAVEGLITVEDLLEEIVGEIADEFDPERPPGIVPLGHGRYRVLGSVSLRQWLALSGMASPESDVETVAGLVMSVLDKVPEVGDTAVYGGMRFTVESLDGHRARTILVAPDRRDRDGARRGQRDDG